MQGGLAAGEAAAGGLQAGAAPLGCLLLALDGRCRYAKGPGRRLGSNEEPPRPGQAKAPLVQQPETAVISATHLCSVTPMRPVAPVRTLAASPSSPGCCEARLASPARDMQRCSVSSKPSGAIIGSCFIWWAQGCALAGYLRPEGQQGGKTGVRACWNPVAASLCLPERYKQAVSM